MHLPRGSAGVAVSVAVHLLFLAALLLVVPKPQPPPAKERSVAVELLSPQQFRAISDPSALPPPVLPAPAMVLPASAPDVISFPADLPLPPHAGETIVPDRLLSAGVLADPRSAEAKAALPQMAPDERVIQLCSIEALAQIAALDDTYHPDMLAAYSMSEIRQTGRSLDAAGAAFRSDGKWYRLGFKCTVSPSLDTVDGFEFTPGEQIPHEQWASHNLVEGEDQDDD